MLEVDIVNNRVGPFRIDQEFPLPSSLVDETGSEVRDGDAIYVEPLVDATIVISVRARGDTLIGKVEEALVHDTSGAWLDGRPMTEVSLRELWPKLAAAGVREIQRDDNFLDLTAATLRLFGDRIELVWLGADPHRFTRPWKPVTDHRFVEAIVRAAEHSSATGGHQTGSIP